MVFKCSYNRLENRDSKLLLCTVEQSKVIYIWDSKTLYVFFKSLLSLRMMISPFCAVSSTTSSYRLFAFDVCLNGDTSRRGQFHYHSFSSPNLEKWIWKTSRRYKYKADKSFRLWASGKFGNTAGINMNTVLEEDYREYKPNSKGGAMEIEGYSIEGISIGGHETCVIVPALKVAFDIGRCPHRAINQEFLFISHGHMDHIGGLPMYVATRSLYSMRPPTIFVPVSIKENVEKLFEVHRAMDQSELKHNLVGLDVGDEYELRKDLVIKPFKTYHVIPSQGYIIYSVKQKLKKKFLRLSGNEIKNLKFSGVKITDTVMSPEIAFTGDTMSDFIVDPNNRDALKAKILIMETTFIDDVMSIEHARDYGHTHLSEVVALAHWFKNKAILLIHFSARYKVEEIQSAVLNLPPPLASKVYTLTEGFRFDHL
eukprot:Gb_05576 [translate_table: standard]